MALVVLLKGVNVGGHRSFRPSLLAQELKRFDVVNVGTAGTFVVRARVTQQEVREAIVSRLPFQPVIVMCDGRELIHAASLDPFARQPASPDIVQFANVLSAPRAATVTLPLNLPPEGNWLVRVLARDGRFVFGLHRREMKAIGQLGRLEQIFDVAGTIRSWTTLLAVTRLLTS